VLAAALPGERSPAPLPGGARASGYTRRVADPRQIPFGHRRPVPFDPPPENIITESSIDSRRAPGREPALGRPSRRLSFDVVRVIAIIGVVAIHTFSRIITTPSMDGTWEEWVAIVLDLGFVWAVPVFVMLSGALILRPTSFARGTLDFYRRRALRIVPALVVWHVVYLVIVRMLVNGESLTAFGAAELVVDGRAYTQLYFLWVILGLYLFAPVIAAFVNDGSPARSLWVGAVALAGTTLAMAVSAFSAHAGSSPRPIATVFFTMWIPYAGYFVLGYALARIPLTRRRILAATVVAIGLGVLTIVQYGAESGFESLDAVSPVSYFSATVAMLSIAVFVAMVGAFDRFPPTGRAAAAVRVLSDASFGVFLVHLAIIAIIAIIVPELYDGTSLTRTAVLFVVTLIASYATSIGASKVPVLRRLF
jgi:surface polysaccharide O-acyltransferase-like enzyme